MPTTTCSARLIQGGLFLLFTVLFIHAIEDPDIWYHMAIGRAVIDSGSIPSQEFYIFTRLGNAAEFHEWGFGVIYHLIHTASGFSGMIILNALIGALTIFLLFKIARNRGYSLSATLAAVAVGYWLMEFRAIIRPENFLYLALAATLFFMDQYRRHRDWRWLTAIPVTAFLLSQCHPSVIMLVFVLGAKLLVLLVNRFIIRNPDVHEQGFHILVIMVVSVLVSAINPYGFDQILLPIKFALETELLDSITEFLPALSTEYAYRFLIAVLLAGASLIILRRQASLWEWMVLAAFALLGYQHARSIALLGIALVLPLAAALHLVSTRYLHGNKIPSTAAGIFFVAVVIDASRFHQLYPEIELFHSPVKSAEIIAKATPNGNLVNFYHLGNYLAWRLWGTHKVLIDGRNFKGNLSLTLHDQILSASPGWKSLMNRYDILAVVTPVTLPYSGDFIPLPFELLHDQDWRMVSREPAGITFIRSQYAGDMATLPAREIWIQAKNELEENLSLYPGSQSSINSLRRVEQKLR